MKNCIGRPTLAITAMAALACLATARTSHAAPVLEIRVGNNGQTLAQSTLISNTNLVYDSNLEKWTFSISDINNQLDVEVTVTTNTPGTSELAELLTVSTTVRDNTAPGNTSREVYITVRDEFDEPTGPNLQLQSIISVDNLAQGGPINNGSFSSFVTVAPNTTIASIAGQAINNTLATQNFANNGPFSLSNITHISTTPNQSTEMSGSTKVVNLDTPPPAVPEPSTLAMAIGLLVPLLGVAGVRHRRRRSVVERT